MHWMIDQAIGYRLLTLRITQRISGKAIAGHVAVNIDDLVQPSWQTRHSDADIGYHAL